MLKKKRFPILEKKGSFKDMRLVPRDFYYSLCLGLLNCRWSNTIRKYICVFESSIFENYNGLMLFEISHI